MSEGHRHTHGPEHDFEPQHGLPQKLPPGETLLWQGAPDFASLAGHVFHVRKLALYFGLMLLLRIGFDVASGAGATAVALAALRFAGLGAAAVGIVLGIAWLTARTSVYTLTDRRVVLRVGIVLSVTFNLPLARIDAAALKLHADGSGHLPLALTAPDKIAFAHLWPHARGWRLARPEPMLLSVPDAQRVAALLGDAWAHVHGKLPARGATPQPRGAFPSAMSAHPIPAHPMPARPILGLAPLPVWSRMLQRLAPRQRSRVPMH